ncbi:MAG: TrkH family potassium uptake protein [Acidobacteriota bacterium]
MSTSILAWRSHFNTAWDAFWLRLGRVNGEWWVIWSFVGLAVLGALLLQLPGTTRRGDLSWIDALFTATSAVCVTGLTVVDTGTTFSPGGQALILGLIQVGGLGIITISTFFAIIMGKKVPLLRGEVVRQTHFSVETGSFRSLVVRILQLTFLFECLGALFLFLVWREEFGTVRGLWLAVFHAVSAFCNAGFSLFPDSLERYVADPLVNGVVMALIVLGGLGFLVIHDVERRLRWGVRLSLHSRLVLIVTGVLILGGTGMICLLEWGNTLADLALPEKVMAAAFQSVTARTAGFNTLPTVDLTNASLVFLMLLMFIGGSPGSTAGGIKTTTFAVLLGTAWNRMRGREATILLNRTVPEKVVNSTLAVVLVAVALLFTAYFSLEWLETGWIPHPRAGNQAFELFFEAVSAFGTVGLSTGLTPRLSDGGKLLLVFLMLVGRIGPLALSVAVSRRSLRRVQYEFYRENVMVG